MLSTRTITELSRALTRACRNVALAGGVILIATVPVSSHVMANIVVWGH